MGESRKEVLKYIDKGLQYIIKIKGTDYIKNNKIKIIKALNNLDLSDKNINIILNKFL